MDFAGRILSETTTQITVPRLTSTIVDRTPLTELSKDGAAAFDRSFVVATLTVPGESVSRNLTYLVPTKQVALPRPRLSVAISQEGEGLEIKIHSDVLARSVRLAYPDWSARLCLYQ